MTALALDAIRKRLAAATPAEWIWGHDEPGNPHSYKVMDFQGAGYLADGMTRGDAEFVAYARDDVPALLGAVENQGRLVALVAPIVESGKGQIGTHSDRCFEYHHGCLAVLVHDLLTAPEATSDLGSTGGEL